jgi:4-nitrophenyl phosphatase
MTLRQFPGVKGIILDMDGVLWKDSQAIGDLPALFAKMEEISLKVTLATNNATRTTDQYLEKLGLFGVRLEPWQIITSAEAVGFLLQKQFPNRGNVFLIGEESLKHVLQEYGFNTSEDTNRDVVAVVAGMDRKLNYDKLRAATLLIRQGIPFIGTNPDRTFPTPEGLIPGTGAILAAIEAATDVEPIIAGKPASSMFNLATERMGLLPHEVLCVGDRLETDIAGGQTVGCKTALVLSGVTTAEAAQKWRPAPDIIVPDLTALIVD